MEDRGDLSPPRCQRLHLFCLPGFTGFDETRLVSPGQLVLSLCIVFQGVVSAVRVP